MGNGSTVSILKDPWLPDVVNPYINTDNEAIQGQMVSVLMEMGEQRWDTDLIQDIF